jgi:hypothetical protein
MQKGRFYFPFCIYDLFRKPFIIYPRLRIRSNFSNFGLKPIYDTHKPPAEAGAIEKNIFNFSNAYFGFKSNKAFFQ